jgi:hypothetical protein
MLFIHLISFDNISQTELKPFQLDDSYFAQDQSLRMIIRPDKKVKQNLNVN